MALSNFKTALSVLLLAVTGWSPLAAQEANTGTENASALPATNVLDRKSLENLRGNSGITLQWISWDYRGDLIVQKIGDAVMIAGIQQGKYDETAALRISGRIAEIGRDYFLLDGTITIRNAPDKERECRLSGDNLRFAITQNRNYWRLRQFEWCDYLTDYIDIYF
ncbi:MAG: hypothetical protein AAGH53_03305 [Pseudomonadota bacterium]